MGMIVNEDVLSKVRENLPLVEEKLSRAEKIAKNIDEVMMNLGPELAGIPLPISRPAALKQLFGPKLIERPAFRVPARRLAT